MNLQEFRQQYPQYDDMSDEDLTKGLHKKFYSDMPFDQFAGKIGYSPTAQAPTAPVAEEKAPTPVAPKETPFLEKPLFERALGSGVAGKTADTLLGGAVDLPIQAMTGVAGGIEMLSNLFGADNKFSQALRGTEGFLQGLLSASAKQDQKEIARILKEAENKGVLDQVQAGLKAFTVAPVDTMAQAFGTMAPVVVAGAAAALAEVPLVVAGAVSTGIGAGMGAGTVKGSIYQATQDILKERTQLSDKEIDKIAEKAQAYNGKNLDNILLGAGLGAVGASTGVESILAKNLAKGITSRAATIQAIEAAGKKETEELAKQGVKKTALKKGLAEFGGEALEGGQEQFAQNVAQRREGYTDVSPMQGVVSQGTLEGTAGFGLGAVGGGREAWRAKQRMAGEPTDEEKALLDPNDVSRREAAVKSHEAISPDLAARLTPSTLATKEQLQKTAPAAKTTAPAEEVDETLNIPTTTEGPTDVGTTDQSTTGTSTTVAGKPAAAAGEPAKTDVSGVVPAETTAGPADAGETAESVALKEEKLKKLSERRIELQGLQDDGLPAGHRLVANKLKALNNLEKELGLKTSTFDNISYATEPEGGSVLSAKKQAPKYVSIADLKTQLEAEGKETPDNLRLVPAGMKLDETGNLIATHPAYKIDPTATADENLKGAMELAAARDKAEAEETQTALEESKKRGERRYEQKNLPDNAEEMYNAVREEKPELPQWYKLEADEKDVFFDNIVHGNAPEYRRAADALIAHKKEKGSRAEGYQKAQEFEGPPTELQKQKLEVADRTSTPAGQRTILNYNQNHDIASKLLGVPLPRWGDLSVAAQRAYLNAIVNNAGSQIDVAFAAAAEQTMRERGDITEQQRQATIDNIRRIQDRVRMESEKNQAALEKLRRDYDRASGTEAFVSQDSVLGKEVLEHLVHGRLNAALTALAAKLKDSPDGRVKLAGQVAKRLSELGLKTTIRISEEPLSDNDLAQYDPMKDEIVIGPDGFSTTTLLHEVTHAGTVRVMYLYLAGKKNLLSERQIKGVEQILKIMRATQQELGKNPEFEAAYESPYEFIAYAMTKKSFQSALEAAGYGHVEALAIEKGLKEAGILTEDTKFGLEQIESILPEKKSAWSAFKKAVAGILNFAKTPFKNLNFVMDLNAAFDDILSVPEGPINVDQTLSAKGSKKKKAAPTPNKQVPAYKAPGFVEPDPRYKLKEGELPTSRWSKIKRALFTRQGWRDTQRAIQDRRAHAKYAQNLAAKSGKVIRDLSKNFNNFYDQLIVAAAEAENFYNGRLQVPMDNLRASVRDFATTMNISINNAMEMLHPMVEAFHEPERRFVKWMMIVPLSKKPELMQNGKLISRAQRREQILGDKEKGIKGLVHEAALSPDQLKSLRQELEFLTGATLVKDEYGMYSFKKTGPGTDPKGGYSPAVGKNIKSDDFYNPLFNVLGVGEEQVNKVREELKTLTVEQREAFRRVMDSSSELSKQATKLEQIGRYWSFPVSNLVGIYNWDYYMPFKGKAAEEEEMIDPNSKRNGREMQEVAHSMDGRFSASNNPILQLMSDATRAAGRAGRRNVTQAVKNALPYDAEKNPQGTGIIDGEVMKHIPFEERESSEVDKYKTENYIFHYNDDGSLDILFVADPKLRNSIRLSFQKTNIALDTANRITGYFGRMHTRYNFDFPVLNFVRDMLTNAWTIGAEFGPTKSMRFIKEVATQVVAHNGLYKALKVAALHTNGDAASLRELHKMEQNDPYARDMLEYIRRGGKTTYLSGFALKSQLQELDKGLGKGRVITKMEDVGKLLDIWVNMFEFASRTAAYSLMRDEFQKRNEAKGMSKADAREEATAEAVSYAKELANFEQVGEYGRALGAAYMFIRPSATGAVRAIEAVAPAFRDVPGLNWAFGSAKDVAMDLPENIRNDPKALEEFMASYKEQQKHARAMIGILMGAGAAMFLLSAAGSADDDEGRNATLNDNMEQWTRYARFHVPDSVAKALGLGKDVVFQLPWGFGLGSFMAMGAQMAAMGMGTVSMKDGFANMTSAALDSFVPIPFSKMPISEHPVAWAIDSAMPTVVRPVVEFMMNKNGIGQDINSAATRRMADAFTGGDRIPELYKDLSESMFEMSAGDVDITPNTLYFFANSYLDGVGRIAQLMYNSGTKTEREFNPRTDLPGLSSFFGAKSNVDAREFGRMETKIKEIDRKLATFDRGIADQDVADRYDEKYPMHRDIVQMYKQHLKQLDVLRKEANDIRTDRELTIGERQEQLRDNMTWQNLIKREMIEQTKDYDPDF